jgi:SAM-dependent methyltransferase
LIVDLGCGSGILAKILTEAGYAVLGVDLSPDMIQLAKVHAPAAEFQVGSLFDARIPRCVAVTAIGECFNYAFDPRAGLPQLARVARRVERALRPRGIFLLDTAGPGRAGPEGIRYVVHDEPAYTLFVRIAEDPTTVTLTRDISLFRRAGRTYRRSDEQHALRLYRPRDVEATLQGAGLEVRRLRAYGDLPLGGGWAAFVAAKAGSRSANKAVAQV